MNVVIEIKDKINIDNSTLQKMIFIYNALEDGWSVKKYQNNYIFTKNHENKREVYLDTYLEDFIKKNVNINNYTNK